VVAFWSHSGEEPSSQAKEHRPTEPKVSGSNPVGRVNKSATEPNPARMVQARHRRVGTGGNENARLAHHRLRVGKRPRRDGCVVPRFPNLWLYQGDAGRRHARLPLERAVPSEAAVARPTDIRDEQRSHRCCRGQENDRRVIAAPVSTAVGARLCSSPRQVAHFTRRGGRDGEQASPWIVAEAVASARVSEAGKAPASRLILRHSPRLRWAPDARLPSRRRVAGPRCAKTSPPRSSNAGSADA
jgi:hypothetical protein